MRVLRLCAKHLFIAAIVAGCAQPASIERNWTLEKIAEALNVSHQTIGRDLDSLSEGCLLRQTFVMRHQIHLKTEAKAWLVDLAHRLCVSELTSL